MTIERNMQDLGARYVRLGHAMKNRRTTLTELVTLSSACGVRMSIVLEAAQRRRSR